METKSKDAISKVSLPLSQRELRVLSLILEGQSSKQVADTLFCTKRTVDFHLTNSYRKLQVANRVQAMRRLVRLGLLEQLDLSARSSM